MRNMIKCLIKGHDYLFVRNLYGDEIISHGYKRSLWKCSKCQKVIAHSGIMHDKKLDKS